MTRDWTHRQLVFARNRLLYAAKQLDFAIERRDQPETGVRAGYAWMTANEGMTELVRVARRLSRDKGNAE